MPGLSYSLVSHTGPATTVAAIDGRPEVTVPTAYTNDTPSIWRWLSTSGPAAASRPRRTRSGPPGEVRENALTWPNRARVASQADPFTSCWWPGAVR